MSKHNTARRVSTRPSRARIAGRRAVALLAATSAIAAGAEAINSATSDDGQRPFTRSELVDLAIGQSTTVDVVAESGDGERALIEKAAPGTLAVADQEIQEGLYRAIDKQFPKGVTQVIDGQTYHVPAVVLNRETGSIDSSLLDPNATQPKNDLHST